MKKLTILLIVILFVLGLVFVWWDNGISAVNKKDDSKKVFVINKNETVREIGNSLRTNGLIKDPVAFFIYIKVFGKDKNIQAGDYRLSPSMDLKTIIDTLNHGTLDKWVTIPEGLRAEEIAEILKGNMENYEESWDNKLAENEGYLFPDTYLLPKDGDIDMIISIFKNNFDKKVEALGFDQAQAKFRRAIITASLIEREAKYAEEMPFVSSVISNRLGVGMPLQIDATVQYVLGYQGSEKRWWKENLTANDLKIASPYNTYANPGLPPTPISNPGMLSLQAALNPADTNYIYYVSDQQGRLHFAKTLAEHNQNIKKYIR